MNKELFWLITVMSLCFFLGEAQAHDDVECVQRAILEEAENQGTAGMIVVAQVIKNRRLDPRWPNKYCEVVMYPGAFPWDIDLPPGRRFDEAAVKQALNVAYQVMADHLPDITDNACFYHKAGINRWYRAQNKSNDWLMRQWWNQAKHHQRIGDHLLYKCEDVT